ncbi:tetratricopeptide repeat protein [Carboxylicivirga sp. N1Y90]|uniref:tetratricopeptide repeat protein n=1 Tax=Carboxylicivirga fragile TaxID=3417571 RepID=UPI003D34E014|nr:tetratricopeptide repeat-containing sensor histidine kinase [Marinilabiliaceae bacterium N1Y90]
MINCLKRCFLITSFVFCLSIISISAQTEESKVLLEQLKNASAKEQVDIYNQLSRAHLYTDPQRAINYAQKALHMAMQQNDKRAEAEAYNNLGMGYYFVNDYEQLLQSYRKSLSTYRNIGDIRSMSMLSSTYFRLKQSDKALKSYKRSLNLYIKEKDWDNISETYKKMADVYKNISDFPMALNYYKKALAIVEQDESDDARNEMVLLLGNIGEICFFQEEYDTALVYFHRMKTILEEVGDHRNKAILLSNMANSYFFKGDLDESFKNYREALEIQIKQNDHWEAAMSLLNIGLIYSKRKEFNLAINSHKKSIALAQSITEANDLLRDNYLALSEIYDALGDFKRAYDYRILYSTLSESMMMEENITQFVDVLALQELEEKKRENEILQAKNKNYLLELEKENLGRWRLSFGFTILIISILVFVIYYRYYLKREEIKNLEERIADALKKQEEQQQIIMHQSSLTSLGELAAGIAHEINQPVQNISLSAESIKYELAESDFNKDFLNQSVAEIFEDIVRVRQIVDHIRIFSSGQKDEVEEDFCVTDCVKSAVSMIGNQYANHHIKLELKLAETLPMVLGNPHKLEQVIHNLLSNAKDAVEERHQNDSDWQMEVGIQTRFEGESVYLEIIDNGIGIAAKRQTDIFLPFVTSKQLGKGTGLGLSISYSLVKEMDGRIEIESKPNEGTKMSVVLPVSKHER